MRVLLTEAAHAAGVRPVLPGLPAGIEATRRSDGRTDVLSLLDHTTRSHDVAVPPGRPLLGPEPANGTVTLPPPGAAVLAVLAVEPGPSR